MDQHPGKRQVDRSVVCVRFWRLELNGIEYHQIKCDPARAVAAAHIYFNTGDVARARRLLPGPLYTEFRFFPGSLASAVGNWISIDDYL